MLATEIKNKAAIFTGHSIGGALASLAALHFLCSSSCSSYPSPSALLCITFGSPLLGNEALCRAVQRERWCGNFCHVVTRHDVVPRLLFCPLNLLPPQLVTHLLQRPQVASPTPVLSDQEKAHLHILISRHIDAAASEQERSDATQQRSTYWPFGNYALCSVEGVVCFDDPLVVVRMLYSTFMTGSPSSSIEGEHLSYGHVLMRVLENLLLKKRIAIEEVPESNFCAGISLALEASGIGIQDMGATKARECLKMSKRLGRSPNLNCASLAIKLGKITPWRAQIEWYKASCDDDMGYYDSFKLRKAPKKDSTTNMNRHRLAQFWDGLIDMLQSNQLPHDFSRRGKWVNAAHFYRLLVEPLDIAEYYRVQKHKKEGHYLTHGRERRYQVFDRWWRDRKRASRGRGEDAKRSKFAGLTQDSCFWAKVEMAKEWLEDAGTESDPAKLAQLLESLKGFESYAKQMVERKEVSIDVLAPRSSYTLWVEEWKVLQFNLGLQIAP